MTVSAIAHAGLTDVNLHVPGYKGASDPGAVGEGIIWIDTTTGPPYVLKVRNALDTDWDEVGASSGGAPDDATYVTLSANGSLSAEAVLGTAVIMAGVIGSRPAFGTAGRVYFATDTGNLSRDTGAAWANIGFTNPMTTAGDLILAGASGVAGRLAKGTDLQVLTIDGTTHLPVWTTPSDPILKSLVDAKGDLLAGTADNTVARLAAGANDTILMADSAQATGLKWVAPATPSTQAFGDAAAEGTGDTFTRGDHKHAMPADPVTAHEAASDPHTGYQKESEKGAASGYAGLNGSSVVPIAQLATGTPDGTKFLRDDNTLAVPSSTGIPASLFDAKGDLIAASAADTAARLAVGTNGQVLTAASGETTGLIWADPAGATSFDDGATPSNLAAAAATGDDTSPSRRDHVHLDPVIAHAAAADPHTGYVLESLIDAAGDLIVGSADNTVARLAKGADSTVLTVDPITHLPTWSAPSGGLAFDDGATPSNLSTAAATGDDASPSRRDHIHLDPVVAHAAAADPHTGYVLESLFDAKGDLITASADNTPAKLTAGANDTILMADSAQSGGLKWVASQTPSTQAFSDAAAEGTADTYARGDHKHAMPADPSATASVAATIFMAERFR